MRQALWAACALVLGALLASALLRAPEDSVAAEGGDEALAALAAPVRGGAPVASGAVAPTWEVGDAWRVQFDEGQPICWLVVVSASDDGYQQGVWCPTEEADDIAAQIAAYELPYLGRFTPDLEGVGHEDAFRFYDWPLADGKRWTTSWEGQEVEVVAEQARPGGRYLFAATYAESEEPFLTYDLDPRLGWWSSMEFASGYVFTVHEHETGWTGDVAFAVGEDRYEARRVASALGNPAVLFGAEAEDDLLALMIDWSGTPTGRFEVRDPDGDAMFQQTMVGSAEDVFQLMPGEAGTWSMLDGVTGLADALIRVRGISVEVASLGVDGVASSSDR